MTYFEVPKAENLNVTITEINFLKKKKPSPNDNYQTHILKNK